MVELIAGHAAEHNVVGTNMTGLLQKPQRQLRSTFV